MQDAVNIPTATATHRREWRDAEEESSKIIRFYGITEWGASPQVFYEDCLRWESSTNLQELTLHEMGIHDIDPIVTLVLMSRSLEYLDVSSNPAIGDDGATQLAIATSNHQLATLCLAGCKITDRGAQQLALHSTVTNLHLHNNQISDAGAVALLDNTNFETLTLAQNQIGNTGAAAIAPILANTTRSLVYLSLFANHEITTVKPFVVALEAAGATSSLRTLVLTPNSSISRTGEQPLLRRIREVLLARRDQDDERR